MRTIVDNESIVKALHGLCTLFAGHGRRASLRVSVPPDLYIQLLEIAPETPEGVLPFDFVVSLEVLPDKELAGLGGILEVIKETDNVQ